MRKTNKLLAMAGIIFFLASCGKTVDVSLSESTAEINPAGEVVEIALTSNGDWNVASTADWVSVSPMSGNGNATLTIEAAENTTNEERVATVEVTTKDKSASLELRQGIRSVFIDLAPAQVESTFEGGQFQIAVNSNIDWTVTDLPQWISCQPTNGTGAATLTLTVSAWDSETEPRQATVKVGNAETEASLRILQNSKPNELITATPRQIEFEYNSTASETISVVCFGSWTVESEFDWVVLSTNSGQGNAEIQVSVTENTDYFERANSLLFVSEFGTEDRVKVLQAGAPNPHFLNLTPEEKTVANEGGSFDITVESDLEWQATTSATWITVTNGQGSGNGTFSIEVAPNLLFTPREARVNVSSEGIYKAVTVFQEGVGQEAFVNLSPNALNIAQYGGVATLTIEANVAWRLEASPWITLLNPTGVANGTCGVAVDANNTYETRTGFIRAYYNNALINEVVVTQEGIPVTLEADQTVIEAIVANNKYVVSITANQEWTAETTASWIALEPRPEANVLILIVMENTTSSPRTGEVRVLGAQHGEITIIVNQAAE